MPSATADPNSDKLSQSVKTRLAIANYLSITCPLLGTETICEMRHSINLTKGLTIIISFLMMVWYGHTAHMGGWVYLALHGSYSVLWVTKDYVFPDGWTTRQTKAGFVNVCITLMGYWMAPYILNSSRFEPSNFRMFSAILLYILGVSLMIGADAQKYYTLQYKRGLITTGFFRYTRNPNYLGEMMLYSAFALLSGSLYPFLYLLAIWYLIFFANMAKKDVSISRYPEWPQYSQTSWMLLPNFPALIADLKENPSGSAAAAPKDS